MSFCIEFEARHEPSVNRQQKQMKWQAVPRLWIVVSRKAGGTLRRGRYPSVTTGECIALIPFMPRDAGLWSGPPMHSFHWKQAKHSVQESQEPKLRCRIGVRTGHDESRRPPRVYSARSKDRDWNEGAECSLSGHEHRRWSIRCFLHHRFLFSAA